MGVQTILGKFMGEGGYIGGGLIIICQGGRKVSQMYFAVI